MRALDARVAAIGHRLAVASVDLCPDRAWLPGLAVHHLSQYGGEYRAAAVSLFGLGEAPAILAVAPAGPAAQAGLRPDDALRAIDGQPLGAAVGSDSGFAAAEQMLDRLEAAFADGAAEIEGVRAGQALSVRVVAVQGCPTRFQLIPSRRMNALADGRYAQVTSAIAEYAADDAELAAVLAHEFSHNLLRHRARLDAAGVARGFLGNFGRNARLIRETEAEADRMSVYVLERAGYDPRAAVRFWSRFGRRGLNLFGSPTHPNWRRRIALFEAEILAIEQARAAGRVPLPLFTSTPPTSTPIGNP
jgi:predicted Zn-dependent protease